MKPRNIELNIDQLVLYGFAPGDRYRIGEAVEWELARLLADRGVPQSLGQGGEIANVNVGAFNVSPGSEPEVIGVQVAMAVYGGLRV